MGRAHVEPTTEAGAKEMRIEVLSKAVVTMGHLFLGFVYPYGEVQVMVDDFERTVWHYENAAAAEEQASGRYGAEAQVASNIALDLFTEYSAQGEAQR